MFESLQRQLLYPGTASSGDDRVLGEIDGLERLWIETDDARVEAWLLVAPTLSEPAPLVMFAHGNGELIEDWARPMARLRNTLGVHVALFEFRGYGRSSGVPSEAAITADAMRLWDSLASRPDVDSDRMIAMGRSLGGGTACALATHRAPAAVVLCSTFCSVPELAKALFGVPGFLVTDRWQNEDAIRAYTGPVLVVHGLNDEIVPHAHGARLAVAAAKGQLVSYNCGHNDWPPSWDTFVSDVAKFLASSNLTGAP